MAIDITPRRIAAVLAGMIALTAIALWQRQSSTDEAVPLAQTQSATIAPASRRDPHAAPRASIGGVIRDESGAPIDGALVCAHGFSPALGGEPLHDPACVVAARDGTYAIDGLFAAQYMVAATARTYRSAWYTRDEQSWQSLAAGERRTGIDITLRRGGAEISGTVTDIGGGVVPHAHVHLDSMLAIEADEHGHYSAWTSPGQLDIRAVADGYAMAQVHAEAPGVYDLQLVAESTFAGTVVDAASGTPMPDVTVAIVAVAGGNQSTPASNTAVTDDSGRFRITRLEPGRYTATARSAHGYGHGDGNIVLALGQHVGDVVVKLYPAQQVIGRIAPPDGETCVDPTLILRDDIHDQTVYAIAEPDGTLHADGVLPGTYVPFPACMNLLSRDQAPIVVGDHDSTDLVWQLDRGSSFTGRVVTSSGAPVEGASISASGRREQPLDRPGGGGTTTSSTGAFALRGLKPGRYTVQVYPPHSFVHGDDKTVEIDLTSPHTTRDFTIDSPTGSIVGSITARDGTPLRRARLIANSVTDPRIQGDAAADDTGKFHCVNVPDGTYDLSVYAATNAKLAIDGSARVTVAGGNVTTLQLVATRPSGAIRGTVTDARGTPVEDAFVTVVHEISDEADVVGARHVGSDTPPVLVSPAGAFAIADLEESAAYTVRAFRRGAEEVIAAHVKPGAQLALKLAATGAITGTVTGARIERLDVALIERDTKDILREDHVFRTNQFAFTDLPPGHYRVSATTAGVHEDVDVDVAEGTRVPLTIELRPTVTLVGRVLDVRTHEPASGLEMSVTKIGVPFTTAPHWDPNAGVTGTDGRFELRDVPRGELEIDGWVRSDDDRFTSILGVKRTVPPTGDAVIDLGDLSVVPSRGKRSDGVIGFEYAVFIESTRRSVRVFSIDAGGPADRAGLAVDDEISTIDGVDVASVPDLIRLMLIGPPGARLAIELATGATVELELGAR